MGRGIKSELAVQGPKAVKAFAAGKAGLQRRGLQKGRDATTFRPAALGLIQRQYPPVSPTLIIARGRRPACQRHELDALTRIGVVLLLVTNWRRQGVMDRDAPRVRQAVSALLVGADRRSAINFFTAPPASTSPWRGSMFRQGGRRPPNHAIRLHP